MTKNNFLAIVVIAITMLGMASCVNNSQKKDEQSKANDTVQVETKTISELSPFEYTPKVPADGKLKGVVELGASGFNLFIIDIDKDKNWVSKKKEFGNSMVTEKMTSPAEVKSTLKDYIKKIADFGVKSKDIHFVVSSGAAKEEITATITKALKEIGYVVNVVTPEQEAKYALRCVLPQEYEDKAFVVDMGSGNTKISYMQDGKRIGKETYGAKYFQKNIEAAAVYDDVKAKMSEIPAGRMQTLFLIGGVPYQMAKEMKKGDERYTVLDTNISAYDALAQKEGEKMTCGLNIYKAILDATNCKQVVFDWDANFTIGFLLAMPY